MGILIDTLDGHVTTSAPHIMVAPLEGQRTYINHISLYNSHSVAQQFKINLISFDVNGDEVARTRFDDEIPLTDSWHFGSFGTLYLVGLGRMELLMDSTPGAPVHWVCDIGVVL